MSVHTKGTIIVSPNLLERSSKHRSQKTWLFLIGQVKKSETGEMDPHANGRANIFHTC
jgi:hypothetical protein